MTDDSSRFDYVPRSMVWDPSRISPTTWPGALEFYRHIEDRNHDFGALRQLVEHVGAQAYATSIFCATSGTSLLVARRPDGEWARDSLRIDLDLSGRIRFVHTDPRLPKSNVFACESASIVDAFERFLAKAKWSTRTGTATG
jgi:hypothetical protein